MANLVLSVFTLLLATKGSVSVNTLESTPPSVNGVLTACADQPFSLTCSHDLDIDISSVTVWNASLPINCTSFATHFNGGGDPCGPFTLDNVTQVVGTPPILHSTLSATAAVGMTGTNIDCQGGSPRVSIGDISLCIVAPPTNIVCKNSSRGLSVSWEPAFDASSSCARNDLNYNVTLTREPNNMMTFSSVVPVTENSADLPNTVELDPSASYLITVSVDLPGTGDTCVGQQVNVTCDTPFPTTTAEPLSSSPTMPTSTGPSTGAVIAIAVVVIVLVFLAIVIVIVVVIILLISSKGKKSAGGGVHAPLATDPEHDSLSGQQQAPVYAMVDKSKKTSAEQPTYQDPATIQHETAESGDLYAVSEKKGKAAKAEEVAELYSEVDKSNKGEGLTYASIEVESKNKPIQKDTDVLYSDIQH